MSESELTIAIEPRSMLGKTGKRLSKDKMAAVYYGHKEKSTPILISKADFKKVYKQAGESTVVTLKEANRDIETLIHEVDFDPIKGEPRHADFYVLEKGRKVEVSVPINFIGESPAVKGGLILVKVMHELEVRAEPKNLPHSIEVDISTLIDEHSRIEIKDLKLGDGVESVVDVTEVVAAITVPKEEKEEEPVDLSTIEVEKKGKKEEEGVPAPAEEKKE
jgi:large subunit ribosomal protein L25